MKDLFDMTLAFEGGKIRTHIIVLSKMTFDISYKNIAVFLC